MMNNSSGPQPQIIRPREPQPSTHPGETSPATLRRHANTRPNLPTPPPKPPVEKKFPPKGVLLPRTGMPAYIYRWRCRHNHADRVPNPNKRDLIDALERELRFYVDNLQITISFANIKGGASKTTTAVYVGSILAHVTKRVFFLLPATNNTPTSTTALNAGIAPDKTLTVAQFAESHESLTSHRSVAGRIPVTAVGLYVLSEDSEDTMTIATGFNRQKFNAVIDTLHDSAYGMLFDTGNDAIDPESVVLEAIRRSDVIVFTGTADKQMTLEKLETTIGFYMSDVHNDNVVRQGRRTETQISTREKAEQSVVVISGSKPNQKSADFEPYVNKRDKHGRIIGSIGWYGKLSLVPRDPYMAKHIVADIKKVQPSTYRAYLEIAIAIYKQAAVLRNINLEFDPNADL